MNSEQRITAVDVTSEASTVAAKAAVQSIDPQEFLRQVDAQVAEFGATETERLGLKEKDVKHWFDANPRHFTRKQRGSTTILHAGLTINHDRFVQSAARGIGYKAQAMGTPDNEGLQLGREFGNRGQCNPTYYTVGNLVKYLKGLEASGIPKQEIIDNYLFMTVGSCGPCRFGTYVTEFRKALRDSGFEGFRVLLVEQNKGLQQATGEELGMEINKDFFMALVTGVMIGDALNALAFRIRPYEVNEGDTNRAVARASDRIAKALETRKGMFKALRQTRKEMAAIEVDRSQAKPKVAIIGEFWAMTTDGDGNYRMKEFLEKEGAEVDVQMAIAWPLYLMWVAKYDVRERMKLGRSDKAIITEAETGVGIGGSKFSLENVNARKKLLMLGVGEKIIRGMFFYYSRMLGLRGYHLPDMQEVADVSHKYYDNRLRGGEGHMEVGKLVQNVLHQKANMTLSIKPFGCMPSSGVSDGVQSLITELHPKAIFLPIETNGDGAVNVYSRVQMQLFKAREAAQKELDEALQQSGLTKESFSQKLKSLKKYRNALYKSKHQVACTAGNLALEVGKG